CATDNRCTLHPDGRHLLVVSWATSSPGIQIVDLLSGSEERLVEKTPALAAAWHPSGDSFAIGRGAVSVYEYPSCKKRWQRKCEAQYSLAFSKNGAVVIAYGWDSVLNVLDANSG